jgi:CheY-like chemotaxis protein
MRSTADQRQEMRDIGFDDLLFKPFDDASLQDLLMRYFDNQELLLANENVLRLGQSNDAEAWIEVFYTRLNLLFPAAIQKVAAACYDLVVVDISTLILRRDLTPKLIIEIDRMVKAVGLRLKLVGPAEGQVLLKEFTETGSIPYFGAIEQALAEG